MKNSQWSRKIENGGKPYILLYSPPFSLHYFPRDKLKLSHYAEVRTGLIQNHLGFDELLSSSFRCPKKIRSFMIFCCLLEKSKSCLNRVKWASMCVKRLKLAAINKEAIWKRLPAMLYTHGWVVYSQVVLLWWRHRFQIASFSPSTLGKQRFQTVPFSNRSTLGPSTLTRIRSNPYTFWYV